MVRKEKEIGILTSIDWNSNSWCGLPTNEDIENSNYGYVNEEGVTHTYLNFDIKSYPSDSTDHHYGLLPQLASKTPQNDGIKAIFIRSLNWHDQENYIVGLYAFPVFERKTIPDNLSRVSNNRLVNVKALPKDIHLIKNFIMLTKLNIPTFLPKGKELGTMGFNYLTATGVGRILDEMSKLNPEDKKLSNIKMRVLKTLI